MDNFLLGLLKGKMVQQNKGFRANHFQTSDCNKLVDAPVRILFLRLIFKSAATIVLSTKDVSEQSNCDMRSVIVPKT